MPECQLVIFDCDGTLMDSETIAAQVELEMMEPYGLKMSPQEFIIRFAGTSSTYFKTTMEEELGRALPDDHDAKVDAALLERLWREVKAVDGVHAMLDRLDQPRCVASNAGAEKLKVELSRAELWDRFRPYVYSVLELNLPAKPDPALFLHAAREFEADPTACMVLEDSVPGIQAAKAAGMRAVGFTGGSHTYQGHADALTEAGAETVLNKMADVPELVAALGLWDGALD
jgi:HAD superfamily hydrolase (TIGR01509 family)